MVGEAVLTSCHVLNKVPTKDNETTPYEQLEKEKNHTLLLAHLGLFGEEDNFFDTYSPVARLTTI